MNHVCVADKPPAGFATPPHTIKKTPCIKPTKSKHLERKNQRPKCVNKVPKNDSLPRISFPTDCNGLCCETRQLDARKYGEISGVGRSVLVAARKSNNS